MVIYALVISAMSDLIIGRLTKTILDTQGKLNLIQADVTALRQKMFNDGHEINFDKFLHFTLLKTKVNSICCPAHPHTTPFPEE